LDRPHALVVEDDASVSELLFSCLTKAGWRVSVAQSGEAALKQIEEDPPEVVVLDLNLPGMNGLDVCRTMRQDRWMGKLPVLMLTGKAEEDDIVAGLEVGADDYMTKPFSPKLLTARVRALLRRSDSHQRKGVLVGDHKIADENAPDLLSVKTLGNCTLRVADRLLSWAEEFSPAQRQLMSMLVGAPSGKISQEEIQAALWPDSSSSRARSSYDSLLSRVRRTLDQNLKPFDSKKYLVVKRGYLCLENAEIDAHEFRRLIHKGNQLLTTGELWLAEIAYSSAFSLWQGTFMPGNFGCDAAFVYQDELEQLFLETSLTFASLLAEGQRYQQAAKLLRDALRYDSTNDRIFRLLYRLYLAEDNLGQAGQVLKLYREALVREHYSEQEILDILQDLPKDKPIRGWLIDA
jgi:DNA-binding response OmpR family regulator